MPGTCPQSWHQNSLQTLPVVPWSSGQMQNAAPAEDHCCRKSVWPHTRRPGFTRVHASSVCLTLSDTMDDSPPGSSVHGILQARILEWLPFSPPGDLPNPGIEPRSPELQADALLSEPHNKSVNSKKKSFCDVPHCTVPSDCPSAERDVVDNELKRRVR